MKQSIYIEQLMELTEAQKNKLKAMDRLPTFDKRIIYIA